MWLIAATTHIIITLPRHDVDDDDDDDVNAVYVPQPRLFGSEELRQMFFPNAKYSGWQAILYIIYYVYIVYSTAPREGKHTRVYMYICTRCKCVSQAYFCERWQQGGNGRALAEAEEAASGPRAERV